MSSATPRLQVTLRWQGMVLGYRLLGRRDSVTVGPARKATFSVPQLSGYPRRLRLLRPVKDGFRLRVGPGMTGEITLRGQEQELAQVLAQPAPKRLLGSAGMFREVDLYPGDAATIVFDAATRLKLQISFTDAPEVVGRPRASRTEPLFLRTSIGTVVVTAALLGLLALFGPSPQDRTPQVTITAERFTKYVAPVLTSPKIKEAREKEKAAEAERKRKEREAREAAEARRMKGERGRLGRADAPNRETILPKGREDVLREKVAKTGLLAALGTAKAPGSGLGKLLDRTPSADIEQAMTGLAGAPLVAGKGSGGLGSAGTGLGGGGTGFGKIQGSGSLDVGTGKGRGRKGPGLGQGKEREVQVGLETGTPEASGGLTKEQINRVVRAHAAAVRYCYEKELQRAPHLEGRVALYWVIRPNGSVDRTRVADTTLGNRNVESCIERQVKQWQFPKSDAETIVQSYPFLFKGGA